jgi:hypothetical protein
MGCTEQGIPVGHLGVEGIIGKMEYRLAVTLQVLSGKRTLVNTILCEHRGGSDPGSWREVHTLLKSKAARRTSEANLRECKSREGWRNSSIAWPIRCRPGPSPGEMPASCPFPWGATPTPCPSEATSAPCPSWPASAPCASGATPVDFPSTPAPCPCPSGVTLAPCPSGAAPAPLLSGATSAPCASGASPAP